jgi:YHS domain-containing protein
MCKERLAKDAALRVAVDPVSGKEVDKATAVIGADSYKRVFYFESQKNFEKFKEAAKKK